MQSRLPLPPLAELNEPQRAIHDSILASRGNLSGPFLAWLHSPGLADPAEKLGAFCRYGTGFTRFEVELLILCVAGHYHCPGEQAIHEPIARDCGMSDDVLRCLRRGETPVLDSARARCLHELASTLVRDKVWPQALYDEGLELLGQQGLVELVGVVGYYAFTAYTLNAFDMRP